MTLKTIYIARHGYRSNWLPTPPAHPEPPTGVNSDVPLAAHGIDQAKELAHYLVSIDNQPQMIVSSPLYRCLQTSEPIADLLDLPIYIDRGLGEWYKPDRDVIPEPASFDILNNFFAGKLKSDWPHSVIPSNKGETETDIFNRCKNFWPIFVRELEERFPDVETVLLVTHAATKIALGMNLLKFDNVRECIDEEGNVIRSASCSLDKYEVLENEDEEDEDESSNTDFNQRVWKLTMNGNTEFLSSGEEMHWDFKFGFEAGSDADIKARENQQQSKQEPVTEEYEHVYVSLDVQNDNYRERNTVENQATLQYSGLETDKPLVKIGDKVYEGTWKKPLGTELAFPNEAASAQKKGDDVGSTGDRVFRITDNLSLNPIQPM